jgi:hypothetical protein
METKQQLESQDQDQQPSSQQSSNELLIVPFVPEGDGWNASDMFLRSLYQRTVDQGLAKIVFWENHVESHQQFVDLAKRHTVVMSFVFMGNDCAGYAWLCPISGNYAYPHFCFFKKIFGDKSREAGRMFIDMWFGFTDEDGGRLLDILFGVIPDFNLVAHKYVEDLGGTKLGKVPKLFKNKLGERRDAFIYYWAPKE